jgi:hypothetical protein
MTELDKVIASMTTKKISQYKPNLATIILCIVIMFSLGLCTGVHIAAS